MYRNLFLLLAMIGFAWGISSCNHNKIACPTYAESFPEGKKKRADPKQAGLPNMGPGGGHRKKAKSVMPGDGPGKKTKVPN